MKEEMWRVCAVLLIGRVPAAGNGQLFCFFCWKEYLCFSISSAYF